MGHQGSASAHAVAVYSGAIWLTTECVHCNEAGVEPFRHKPAIEKDQRDSFFALCSDAQRHLNRLDTGLRAATTNH